MKTITLPAPREITFPLGQALAQRRTQRSFSQAPLTDLELSTLLWATAGETTADGKRTAPLIKFAQIYHLANSFGLCHFSSYGG